jgi:hypothetical protein
MGKPVRDELVKRIKTMGKPIAVGSDRASSSKPEYGFQTFTEQSPNMIFINKGAVSSMPTKDAARLWATAGKNSNLRVLI